MLCFRRIVFSLTVMVGALVVHTSGRGQSEQLASAFESEPAKTFRAGVAAVDITPEPPSIIAGGFLEGRADRIHDRLYARCFVLDDGSMRMALVIVDTCMMPTQLIDRAKQLASRQCGIPVERMMVSATHTHSAPAAMGCLGTRKDESYAAWLPGKIAEAIRNANENLQTARIGWAAIDDWEHTHNRRWIRQPDKMVVDPFGQATGRAHMHPGYLSPDIIGPSGPVDPALSVISLQKLDGQPLGVLANYSQHYFGAPAVSADYYGQFCNYIAELLQQPGAGNGPFVCALSQGTSGDLMWMDYGSAKQDLTIERYTQTMVQYAEQALRQVRFHDDVSLAMVEKELTLKYRVPDENRLAWARPIAQRIDDDLPKNLPEVYAREAIILHQRQQTTLKLQAIRIGNLTIATLPNEVYALTGLKLRGRSPGSMHFNIELANGAEGYIPPPEQHHLGGYTTWPARTAGLEVQAEPQIVNTLVDALEQVTGLPRRTMIDHHGPYALAILECRPVAYWRMNDEDGTFARISADGGRPAKLHGGFAWYLPGAGSGSGIGEGQQLTTSEFSGPSQINRAVHLADGWIEAPVELPAPNYSVAFWFWGGEPSGASQRQGALVVDPHGETLIARQDVNHRVRLEMNGQLTAKEWPADQWHLVVAVRTDQQIQVFVDGDLQPSLQVELTATSHPIAAANQLIFGQQFQGKLDEIAVFGRCLSAEEIDGFWQVSDSDQRRH